MEASSAKKKQYLMLGGFLAVVGLIAVYTFVTISGDTPQTAIEESVVQAPGGRQVDNTNDNIDNLPEPYKRSLEEYNERLDKEALASPDVMGSMPAFAPRNVEVAVEPDDPAAMARQDEIRQLEQARSRVQYEERKTPRKVYSVEEYALIMNSYQNVMRDFYTEDTTGKMKPVPPVVASLEDFRAVASLNSGVAPVDPREANGAPQVFSEADANALIQETFPVKAGDIFYGYYINQVDTASRSDVIVQVTSGPLKGARLIGQPTLVNKKALIRFTKAEIEGQKLNLSAASVNVSDVSTLIEGEYDGAYWRRLGLPGLAALISGTTKAANEILKNEGTTVTLNNNGSNVFSTPRTSTSEALKKGTFGGVSAAGELVANELVREGQQSIPSVSIPANTPTAILLFSGASIPKGAEFKGRTVLTDKNFLGGSLTPAERNSIQR